MAAVTGLRTDEGNHQALFDMWETHRFPPALYDIGTSILPNPSDCFDCFQLTIRLRSAVF